MELRTSSDDFMKLRPKFTPSRTDSRSSLSSNSQDSLSHSFSSNKREYKRKHDVLVKICVIGDSSVGKTALTNRYVDDYFQYDTLATIGMDLRIKTTKLDGKVIKTQVWDTAGQEKYRAITKAYYKNADGIMIVFDITNRDSFRKLGLWIADYQRQTRSYEPVPMVVVGNKADLEDKRIIGYEEAKGFCDDMQITYFETSAATGLGVVGAYSSLTREAAILKCSKEEQESLKMKGSGKKSKCSKCVIS